MSAERAFYAAMALAILATVFIGFAPTYYLRSHFHPEPLPQLLHLHGLVFSGWIALFFAQTFLVAARRVDLHRKLGLAGAVLAGALTALGIATAVWSGRRALAAGHMGALAFLVTPFGDMLMFVIFGATGLIYRRQPEAHKRLMLLATISLLGAPLSRWPVRIMAANPMAPFIFADLFLAAGVTFDLVRKRRVHPSYAWGGLLFVASQPLRLALSRTDAWMAFARILLAGP